jgi:hypothetical protein
MGMVDDADGRYRGSYDIDPDILPVEGTEIAPIPF